MAQRRMVSKSVIDTDAFLDLPLTAQALYLHLLLRADDDGFVSSPQSIMRMVGGSKDDLRLLIGKGYLIAWDSGVMVIRHWLLHNAVPRQAYTPTFCRMEAAGLYVTADRVYTIDAAEGEPFQGAVEHKESKYTRKDYLARQEAALPAPEEQEPAPIKVKGPEKIPPEMQRLMNVYNTNRPQNLPQVTRITPRTKRYMHAQAMIEAYGPDHAAEIVMKALRSEYLTGQKWFCFDWVVNPENCTKIDEGRYDDRRQSIFPQTVQPVQPQETAEDYGF